MGHANGVRYAEAKYDNVRDGQTAFYLEFHCNALWLVLPAKRSASGSCAGDGDCRLETPNPTLRQDSGNLLRPTCSNYAALQFSWCCQEGVREGKL